MHNRYMAHKRKRLRSALFALALSAPLCMGFTGGTGPSTEAAAKAGVGQPAQAAGIPAPFRGITLTTIKDLDRTLSVIKSSPRKLTVRIVVQPNVSMDEYRRAVEALHPHAYIMAEILDASTWAAADIGSLRDLANDAVETLGDEVDLWEVGNELNGSWLGPSPQAINAKAEAVRSIVASHGGRTAVTLNYWDEDKECYEKPWENLNSYARSMPASLRQVDYLFLSVYEFSCKPAQHPSARDLAGALKTMGKLFPRAKLGIGEIAANGPDDEAPESSLSVKKRIAKRYYGMHKKLQSKVGSRYVGGYFWWFFYEDAVRNNGPLWPTLKSLVSKI